jgi:hypothetical protein
MNAAWIALACRYSLSWSQEIYKHMEAAGAWAPADV